MRLGDCFVPRSGVNDHLFVVISDPTKKPDQVLLVSVTTYREYKEDACLLNANEHPWVRHLSCIAYDRARFRSNAELDQVRDAGLLQMFPPFPDHLLRPIWAGAAASAKLEDAYADLLIEQGFLDI